VDAARIAPLRARHEDAVSRLDLGERRPREALEQILRGAARRTAAGPRSLPPASQPRPQLRRDAAQARVGADGDANGLARLLVANRQLAPGGIDPRHRARQRAEGTEDDLLGDETAPVLAAVAQRPELVADPHLGEGTRTRIAEL